MRQEPDKTASELFNREIENAGGNTDIEVSFVKYLSRLISQEQYNKERKTPTTATSLQKPDYICNNFKQNF